MQPAGYSSPTVVNDDHGAGSSWPATPSLQEQRIRALTKLCDRSIIGSAKVRRVSVRKTTTHSLSRSSPNATPTTTVIPATSALSTGPLRTSNVSVGDGESKLECIIQQLDKVSKALTHRRSASGSQGATLNCANGVDLSSPSSTTSTFEAIASLPLPPPSDSKCMTSIRGNSSMQHPTPPMPFTTAAHKTLLDLTSDHDRDFLMTKHTIHGGRTILVPVHPTDFPCRVGQVTLELVHDSRIAAPCSSDRFQTKVAAYLHSGFQKPWLLHSAPAMSMSAAGNPINGRKRKAAATDTLPTIASYATSGAGVALKENVLSLAGGAYALPMDQHIRLNLLSRLADDYILHVNELTAQGSATASTPTTASLLHDDEGRYRPPLSHRSSHTNYLSERYSPDQPSAMCLDFEIYLPDRFLSPSTIRRLGAVFTLEVQCLLEKWVGPLCISMTDYTIVDVKTEQGVAVTREMCKTAVHFIWPFASANREQKAQGMLLCIQAARRYFGTNNPYDSKHGLEQCIDMSVLENGLRFNFMHKSKPCTENPGQSCYDRGCALCAGTGKIDMGRAYRLIDIVNLRADGEYDQLRPSAEHTTTTTTTPTVKLKVSSIVRDVLVLCNVIPPSHVLSATAPRDIDDNEANVSSSSSSASIDVTVGLETIQQIPLLELCLTSLFPIEAVGRDPNVRTDYTTRNVSPALSTNATPLTLKWTDVSTGTVLHEASLVPSSSSTSRRASLSDAHGTSESALTDVDTINTHSSTNKRAKRNKPSLTEFLHGVVLPSQDENDTKDKDGNFLWKPNATEYDLHALLPVNKQKTILNRAVLGAGLVGSSGARGGAGVGPNGIQAATQVRALSCYRVSLAPTLNYEAKNGGRSMAARKYPKWTGDAKTLYQIQSVFQSPIVRALFFEQKIVPGTGGIRTDPDGKCIFVYITGNYCLIKGHCITRNGPREHCDALNSVARRHLADRAAHGRSDTYLKICSVTHCVYFGCFSPKPYGLFRGDTTSKPLTCKEFTRKHNKLLVVTRLSMEQVNALFPRKRADTSALASYASSVLSSPYTTEAKKRLASQQKAESLWSLKADPSCSLTTSNSSTTVATEEKEDKPLSSHFSMTSRAHTPTLQQARTKPIVRSISSQSLPQRTSSAGRVQILPTTPPVASLPSTSKYSVPSPVVSSPTAHHSSMLSVKDFDTIDNRGLDSYAAYAYASALQ